MLEFTLNRLNEIIEKLGKRITKLVYKNKTLTKRAESAEGDWEIAEQIIDRLKAVNKELREYKLIFDDDTALKHVIELREEIIESKPRTKS